MVQKVDYQWYRRQTINGTEGRLSMVQKADHQWYRRQTSWDHVAGTMLLGHHPSHQPTAVCTPLLVCGQRGASTLPHALCSLAVWGRTCSGKLRGKRRERLAVCEYCWCLVSVRPAPCLTLCAPPLCGAVPVGGSHVVRGEGEAGAV